MLPVTAWPWTVPDMMHMPIATASALRLKLFRKYDGPFGLVISTPLLPGKDAWITPSNLDSNVPFTKHEACRSDAVSADDRKRRYASFLNGMGPARQCISPAPGLLVTKRI